MLKHKYRYGLSFLLLTVFTPWLWAQGEGTFLSGVRQLIYEGKRSGEGYFSKSGRYLIFQSEREPSNPFYQMYVLDFETGDIDLVSPGIGKTTCGYFNWADENQLLFSSSHHDPEAVEKQKAELDFRASGQSRRYSWDYEPEMDVFLLDREKEDLKNLTSAPGYDAEASFSPDGKYIAFTSNRHAFTEDASEEIRKKLAIDPSVYNEIYLMHSDGSEVRRLTHHHGYDGGPFFSPDGQRIIWRRFNTKGDIADIYTMAIDGSDVCQLTDFKCMSWAPFYHPSGSYVIFASNKLGFANFELYLVDAEGQKEPIQITYTEGFDGLPVFSPNGNQLVWTSNRTSDGAAQLFIANWDHGAALEALTKAPNRTQGHTFSAEVTEKDLEEKIYYLAADELHGRMTGSEGAAKAAAYAVDLFSRSGAKPLPSYNFKMPFDFSARTRVDSASTFLQYAGQNFTLGTDYHTLHFSEAGEVQGELVFAGYGLNIPDENGYNSYLGLNVKGKIVMILKEIANSGDPELDKLVSRYGALRYRAMLAREAGAIGIIVVGEPSDQKPSTMAASGGIVAASITLQKAAQWFSSEGKDLDSIGTTLSDFNPHVASSFHFTSPVQLSIGLVKERAIGRNVVAHLPAATPSDSYIVLGAHYDHLGMGETGSLLADNQHDQIHNGADDNASGTALILELAEYLASLREENPSLFTHHILFALWSGEELGLIGSSAFCDQVPIPLDKVKAYLNYDMVGRMKENRLILQGLGSGAEWKKLVEKKNIVHGFQLVLQEDPFLPTDATSFYKNGIPILSFFTGLHDDYHRPSDDADKINYTGLSRITRFSADLLMELMKQDITYQKAEMSASQANIRGFNVYLGTIPDYAAEVTGVQLSGVRPGGPADGAGLQARDILIELAGKEIQNIYDYTYILGELEVGKEVKMVILRDGEKMEIKIVPGSR